MNAPATAPAALLRSAVEALPQRRRNRPYQDAALEAFRSSTMARGLLCLATGLGKTHVAAQLPRALGAARTLVLAHREELVQQLADAFAGEGLTVGVEKAERQARGTENVIVASTATLAVSPKRLERLQPDTFDLVIRDEAHHAMARTEMKLWERLGFIDEAGNKIEKPRARLVGLTATPGRSDGETLREVFDGIVFSMSLPDGIRAGFLVPIRAFTVATTAVLDDVAVRGGEYAVGDLEAAVNIDARNGAIFDACSRHAPTLRTLIFGVTVKHAKDIAAFFNERDRPARTVFGDMDADERREAFAWFASTPGAVLTNCQLVDEGTDVPGIECVVMGAPTKSAIRYAQRVGRGTRLAAGAHDIGESIARGKSECLVLDVTDSTVNTARRAFNINDLFNMPKRAKRLAGQNVLEELDRQAEEEQIEEEKAREAQRVATASRAFDLFGAAAAAKERLPASAKLAWTFSNDMFSLTLPGDRRARVHEDALGGWHFDMFGKGEWTRVNRAPVIGPDALEKIVAFIERKARDCLTPRELSLVLRDAKWRSRSDPPTDKQLDAARRMRIPVPDGISRAELSDAISARVAQFRRNR